MKLLGIKRNKFVSKYIIKIQPMEPSFLILISLILILDGGISYLYRKPVLLRLVMKKMGNTAGNRISKSTSIYVNLTKVERKLVEPARSVCVNKPT